MVTSPLGKEFTRGASSCGKTEMCAKCDWTATEYRNGLRDKRKGV